jgi:hypothetical protein
MKVAIVFPLLFIALVSAAQEKNVPGNPWQKEGKERETLLLKKYYLPDSLKILPFNKRLLEENRFAFPPDNKGNILKDPGSYNNSTSSFRMGMPIYNPPFNSKMPEMKIDTTVNYYLQIKRIPITQPYRK